jgi:hypothetical protein
MKLAVIAMFTEILAHSARFLPTSPSAGRISLSIWVARDETKNASWSGVRIFVRSYVGLTSLRQPIDQIGTRVVQLLYSLIRGEDGLV